MECKETIPALYKRWGMKKSQVKVKVEKSRPKWEIAFKDLIELDVKGLSHIYSAFCFIFMQFSTPQWFVKFYHNLWIIINKYHNIDKYYLLFALFIATQMQMLVWRNSSSSLYSRMFTFWTNLHNFWAITGNGMKRGNTGREVKGMSETFNLAC